MLLHGAEGFTGGAQHLASGVLFLALASPRSTVPIVAAIMAELESLLGVEKAARAFSLIASGAHLSPNFAPSREMSVYVLGKLDEGRKIVLI